MPSRRSIFALTKRGEKLSISYKQALYHLTYYSAEFENLFSAGGRVVFIEPSASAFERSSLVGRRLFGVTMFGLFGHPRACPNADGYLGLMSQTSYIIISGTYTQALFMHECTGIRTCSVTYHMSDPHTPLFLMLTHLFGLFSGFTTFRGDLKAIVRLRGCEWQYEWENEWPSERTSVSGAFVWF